jgi:predicted HAD superfamily Cof-like phosphohydrolase
MTKQETAQSQWECIQHLLANEFATVTVVADDMNMMHNKYGVQEAIDKLTPEQLVEFIKFRFNFLQEEVDEGQKAITEKNAEEVIDSLIDLVVVAVGTLDLLKVNFSKAWYEVMAANMNKEVGIKASRPNPLGLPDLIKPDGWTAPSHEGNHGLATKAFSA